MTDWLELGEPGYVPKVAHFDEPPKKNRDDHFMLVPLTYEDLQIIDESLDALLLEYAIHDDEVKPFTSEKIRYLRECLQSWDIFVD